MRNFRYCISLLLLGLVRFPVWAGDNKIFVEKTVVAAGKEVVMMVDLDNQDAVNGIQFDVCLPQGVAIADTDERRPERTMRLGSMELISKEVGKGVYRILAFSMRGDVVKGQSGAIIALPLKVEPGLAKGEYEVKLTRATLSVSGKEMSASSVTLADTSSILIVE